MICDKDLTQDRLPEDRRHILVVDDDPLFRSLMVSVLRNDFVVSVAGDGADGFYRALDQVPHVAVLDIQMPGWDGLKTLRAFRAHPALAHVRVVVLTSDASRETVLAAIHAGADDYIIKTAFSRDDFRQKLDRLLRQPRSGMADVSPTGEIAESGVRTSEDEGSFETVEATASSPPFLGWAASEDLLQEAIDAWE